MGNSCCALLPASENHNIHHDEIMHGACGSRGVRGAKEYLIAAHFARLLLLFILAVHLTVALEQGEVDSSLVRGLVHLGKVGLARRVALEPVLLGALPTAHAAVAVLAAERQVERAEKLSVSGADADALIGVRRILRKGYLLSQGGRVS